MWSWLETFWKATFLEYQFLWRTCERNLRIPKEQIYLSEMSLSYIIYFSLWSGSLAQNQLRNCIWNTLNWYYYIIGVYSQRQILFAVVSQYFNENRYNTKKHQATHMCIEILHLINSVHIYCIFASHCLYYTIL